MNKITTDNVRLRYVVILIWSIFFFLFFGLQQIINWPFLGSLHVKLSPPFIDLGPTIRALECYRSIGLEVYTVGDTSECWYLYGSTLLRILAPTGLAVNSTVAIGWFFIALASVIFGYVFFLITTNSKLITIVSLLIILSPVTMLLLERGNIDIINLSFLIFSAIIFKKGFKLGAVLLILFTSLIKFYTLPLAFIFCFLIPNKKQKLIGFVFVLLTFVQVLDDLQRLKDLPKVVNSSFGNVLLAMYFVEFNLKLSSALQYVIGIFLLLIIIIILKKLQQSWKIFEVKPFPNIENWTTSNCLQIMFILTFLSCYFTGVSFDFRLIFLSLACLLEIERTYKGCNIFPVLIGLDLVNNWVSNTRYLEPLGDLSLLLITAYYLLLLGPLIKSVNKTQLSKKRFLN